MKVRLIDFTFLKLRISIITKNNFEKSLIIITEKFYTYTDSFKLMSIKSLINLLSRVRTFYCDFKHYNCYDDNDIVNYVISTIKRQYKAKKIREAIPTIYLIHDFNISYDDNIIINNYIQNSDKF